MKWFNYVAALGGVLSALIAAWLSYTGAIRSADTSAFKLEIESKYANKTDVSAMSNKVDQIAIDVSEIKGYLKAEEGYSDARSPSDTAHK